MDNQPKKISLRSIVMLLIFIIVIPFLPLILSRQWDWWEAWVYAIIGILGVAVSRLIASRRNPDLLVERARFLQLDDAKSWDKILAPLVGFGGGLIPLVAGLEAMIYWPTPFNITVKFLALTFILVGYALGSYALIENRFFSGMVRIQTDRGHQLVSSGPYRWIRHPGYTGALLTYLATPFFLDSRWSFIPALFITIVLVIRTRLEDEVLQNELEGYRAYMKQVRYRLLPGLW